MGGYKEVVRSGGDERLGRGERGYGGFVKRFPGIRLVSRLVPSGVISPRYTTLPRSVNMPS